MNHRYFVDKNDCNIDDRREGMYFLVQEGQEISMISGDFFRRIQVNFDSGGVEIPQKFQSFLKFY